MTFDLSPLYRTAIGFDRVADMLSTAARNESGGYPPYNIESLDEDHYRISMAVAGFSESELDIVVENDKLTISGSKSTSEQDANRQYLYRGIATRSFEKKFNLAEYVEVTNANLVNGLLTIKLNKELPEAMKPKSIKITSVDNSSKQKKLSAA